VTNSGKIKSGSGGGVSSLEDATAESWPELAHRELVSRIVASPTFSRAERLSSLLTYICDIALKGRAGELNEQRLGQAVFGRSPDYDCSVDGIVRTQASRLRQRLDQYFDQEGAQEPVLLVIPKGGYVPVFTPRNVAGPTVTHISEAEGRPAFHQGHLIQARTSRLMVPWALCALLAVALVLVLIHYRIRAAAEATQVTSHPLWGRIFSPGQATLEVPGDSGLVIAHSLDRRDLPLLEYIGGPTKKSDSSLRQATPEEEDVHAIISRRRYTSIVDLEVAVSLGQIAERTRSSLDIRFPRDLRPNDLKHGNSILVGASEANPWVELFEPNMNFVVENDFASHTYVVRNRLPQPGEPPSWQLNAGDPQRRVFGIIALVPNLTNTGSVLIIEGISMAGTEAAWDFVSHDSELLPFLKKIQRPDGTVPSFELLLGTQNMSSSAVHGTVLAWRAHQ